MFVVAAMLSDSEFTGISRGNLRCRVVMFNHLVYRGNCSWIICSWYTGRWWVGCYIWYSEEGTGRGRSPPSPFLAVPNVTAYPSTASVPITVSLYNVQLLCGFNESIKGLTQQGHATTCFQFHTQTWQDIQAATINSVTTDANHLIRSTQFSQLNFTFVCLHETRICNSR